MIDASNIRNRFRAFRIRAPRLQFRLANGDQSMVDDNHGRDFVIESSGRYVIHPGAPSGRGLTRVSDVQLPDVLRPLRPTDSTIDLVFTNAGAGSSSWRSAYVVYMPVASRDAVSFSTASSTEEWMTLPMNKSALHVPHGRTVTWCVCIDAQYGIDCAFNDGGQQWDSNQTQNYKIRLPGRYSVGNGYLQYDGVAQLDMHNKTPF